MQYFCTYSVGLVCLGSKNNLRHHRSSRTAPHAKILLNTNRDTHSSCTLILKQTKKMNLWETQDFISVMFFVFLACPGLKTNQHAKWLPYTRHHKPLLITSRSWIQAIHKDRIFWKNLLKNKEMVFENGVKNIQAAAYNGARTVSTSGEVSTRDWNLILLVQY